MGSTGTLDSPWHLAHGVRATVPHRLASGLVVQLWRSGPEPHRHGWYEPAALLCHRVRGSAGSADIDLDSLVFVGRIDVRPGGALFLYRHRRTGGELLVDANGTPHRAVRDARRRAGVRFEVQSAVDAVALLGRPTHPAGSTASTRGAARPPEDQAGSTASTRGAARPPEDQAGSTARRPTAAPPPEDQAGSTASTRGAARPPEDQAGSTAHRLTAAPLPARAAQLPSAEGPRAVPTDDAPARIGTDATSTPPQAHDTTAVRDGRDGVAAGLATVLPFRPRRAP
jgi:hypothetical protein